MRRGLLCALWRRGGPAAADLRPGFLEITAGWMLVDDNEALARRIEDCLVWGRRNGDFLPDEAATVEFMQASYSARIVRDIFGAFEDPPSEP